MNANELFIGALVRVNREGLSVKKGTIVEIRGIDADIKLVGKGIVGSALCRQMDDERHGIWCEYLEPIPITPEILEKNGFVNNYNEDCWVNGEVGWLAKTDWKSLYWECEILGANTFVGTLSFAHELQHALNLCGIEKEIVL